jgi:hypothetical protein
MWISSLIPLLMLSIDSMHSPIYRICCGNLSRLSRSLSEHDRHLIRTTYFLVNSGSSKSYSHCTTCSAMQGHSSVVKLLKEACPAACSILDNRVCSFTPELLYLHFFFGF